MSEEQGPTVTSITYSAALGFSVDLELFSRHHPFAYVCKYNPSQFPSLTYSRAREEPSFVVFPNGRVVVIAHQIGEVEAAYGAFKEEMRLYKLGETRPRRSERRKT